MLRSRLLKGEGEGEEYQVSLTMFEDYVAGHKKELVMTGYPD